MQAIVQERYGEDPGEVLRETSVPPPAPGDREVLLRVHAAGVDRGTWHLMAGLPHLVRAVGFGLRAPKRRIPGSDVAGTVDAVGPGVTGFRVGEEVFGTCRGAFAEYAVARADRLAPKPANLTFAQAAAVPTSAATALQALRDKARVQSGEHVLVLGASGGVGTFAVQLAKAFGAEVTGVCRADKAEFVRALGADHVVDYASTDVTDGPDRYDVILDIGGNRRLSRLRRVLTRTGRLVIVGGEGGGRWLGGIERNLRAHLLSPFVPQRLGAFVARENAADLLVLRDLVESGQVVPALDRTYPLGDAAAALRRLVAGEVRGKVVLTV